MRWSPPEQNAQPPSLGDGPLPVSRMTPTSERHARVVEHSVELVDGVRPERVAHLGPVERDADGRLALPVDDVPVVGDVGQVEALDGLPARDGSNGLSVLVSLLTALTLELGGVSQEQPRGTDGTTGRSRATYGEATMKRSASVLVSGVIAGVHARRMFAVVHRWRHQVQGLPRSADQKHADRSGLQDVEGRKGFGRRPVCEITGTRLSVQTWCQTLGTPDSKIKEAPHL